MLKLLLPIILLTGCADWKINSMQESTLVTITKNMAIINPRSSYWIELDKVLLDNKVTIEEYETLQGIYKTELIRYDMEN